MSDEPPSDAAAPLSPAAANQRSGADRVALYVPRILQQHLGAGAQQRSWMREGSAAFVDISGFTALSEQLARKGREGAEQIAETIGGSFEHILQVAYASGGSLLKFGGDALLLWFEGDAHVLRASQAAVLMRRKLDDVGRIDLPDAQVTLKMSQGVHSGLFHFFAVGTTHVELLPTGPGWSRLVAMEQAASAGEILLSTETAALLPADCLGATLGPGVLLNEVPGEIAEQPLVPRPEVPPATLAHCLSPAVRISLPPSASRSEASSATSCASVAASTTLTSWCSASAAASGPCAAISASVPS